MQLKDFVPPIIVKAAKRLKYSVDNGDRYGQKLYDSYESALALCKSGYEQNDLVSVVYEKTRLYRDLILSQHPFVSEISSLRTLVGLSLSSRCALRGNKLNVIDFGGACGAHYFIAKRVFGDGIDLRWHVVETPNMVSRAIGLEDGRLKFFDDLEKAKAGVDHVDLVFSSGALQYVPRPYEFLEGLTECKADNIFITRVGLSTLPKELVIIQRSHLRENGIGPMPQGMQDGVAQHPVTFARKDKFEEILSRRYSIDILFNEDKGGYHAANQPVDMYGYFGTLKR